MNGYEKHSRSYGGPKPTGRGLIVDAIILVGIVVAIALLWRPDPGAIGRGGQETAMPLPASPHTFGPATAAHLSGIGAFIGHQRPTQLNAPATRPIDFFVAIGAGLQAISSASGQACGRTERIRMDKAETTRARPYPTDFPPRAHADGHIEIKNEPFRPA